MTVGTDLADEITLNETTGVTDPVVTPVQIHSRFPAGSSLSEDPGGMRPTTVTEHDSAGGADLVDILAELKPVGNQQGADLAARFPFSAQYKRGRIESGPLFQYAGETFNCCIAKTWHKGRWHFTVFLREHVGTTTYRKRDGSRGQRWTWTYHMRQSFLSVGQAYDLFERLCMAQRNEQELDDPYHTPFMSGPETPWDPHVLRDMAIAQEQRDRASEAHASVDWDSVDWTVINLDAAPQ